MGDARLAGLIDWLAITDRTRNLRENSHWDGAESIMNAAASSFAVDKWSNQEYRPEVWIEKDALAGVLQVACEPLDVPYFSCRGYTSLSEVWSAARRLARHARSGQTPIVFHLGDHDPSGIDMSRDIQARLATFGAEVEFRRLALNMDQVDKHKPPPNPAKTTDSRFQSYMDLYGDESWELDALDPATLSRLITDEVSAIRDQEAWDEKCQEEEEVKERLRTVALRWADVQEYIDNN